MVQNPEVTVAVCNYNQGRYLGQCLDSLKAQVDCCDYEVIVIDDGSTDGSYNVILEHRWPNMRFNNYKQNQGLNNALNIALQEAKGRFFVRLDADDWAMPNFVRSLWMDCSGTTLTYSDYIEVSSTEIKHCSVSHRNIYSMQASGIMVKTDILRKFGYRDMFWEEYDLLLRLMHSGEYTFRKVKKPLWVYRKHDSNMTNDFFAKLEGWRQLVKEHGEEVFGVGQMDLRLMELL